MDQSTAKLTVFFEDPFWVGLYARLSDGRLEVCKITFGAEPKDYEVYSFLLENWSRLQFSPGVEAGETEGRAKNPKRMQREAKRQITNTAVGTKAQQALKLQQEQGKLEHKERSKQQREAEKERKLELRLEKRKEKHRGH